MGILVLKHRACEKHEHLTTMSTVKKHAIFHLPFDMDFCAIKFARLLNKEGFNIFGNAPFIARADKEGGIPFGVSNDDSRYADILITVGDYSKNSRQFQCCGNANSIDIDVSSLENEIQAMWLVMIVSRFRIDFGENSSPEEVANYATFEPFLEALKKHKHTVIIRASEMVAQDLRLEKAVIDLGEAYRSSVTHSPFIDKLVELAAEKPDSIYAYIVAKLDTIPE